MNKAVSKFSCALLTALTLFVLTAAPASAASNAAVVQSYEDCAVFSDRTYCSKLHAVIKVTQTPSGNVHQTANYKFTVNFYHNGVSYYSIEGSSHSAELYKDAQTHQLIARGSFSRTYLGQYCEGDTSLIYANGRMIVQINNFTCSPV